MICCSEARVTKEIENEININGYNKIICMSNSRKTGGVVIYIKKELEYRLIFSNAIVDTFWCLTVEILKSKFMGIYSCFYRANKAKKNIFENLFDEFLSKTINSNKLVVCTGDLNMNLNENNSNKNLFNKVCDRYGLQNIANFNTRVTNLSQTKIDVVLTNKRDAIKCNANVKERVSRP